jgi:phenylpropionate dioxygenase-like ring-hydroxylating dioxygenase large terminal subunit
VGRWQPCDLDAVERELAELGMRFLKNIWYVASSAREVGSSALLARRLCDVGVVIFRDEQGSPRALEDRCPHRFAPLSKGKLSNGVVACGYHGLVFNGEGACVANPHGPIPSAARVRSLPIVERHSLLWIWLGDPERADEALVPDFSFMDPESFYVGQGYLHVRSNYLLEIDNIMDLSHLEFLHPSSLGSGEFEKREYSARREGDTVWSKRFIFGEILSEGLAQRMGIPPSCRADRWLDVRWTAPANMAIFTGAVVSGRPRQEGIVYPAAHCFTPETATTTHYWYGMGFPKSVGESGAAMVEDAMRYLRVPFEGEDLPILEAQQHNLGSHDLLELKPVILPSDAGGVYARRTLERLISAES